MTKIKYSTLFMLSYALYIVNRLINTVNGINSELYAPATLLFLAVSLLTFFRIQKKATGRLSKSQRRLIYFIILWILWGTVISYTSALSSTAFSFLKIYIPFVILLLLSGYIVSYYDISNEFVNLSIVVLGSFLVWRYIANFNGLDFIDGLRYIFSASKVERYRVSYGIYHANAAGNLCLCYIILIVLHRIQGSNEKKKLEMRVFDIYSLFCLIISVFMLLSTASRSSITSILVFCVMFYFLKLYYSGTKKWKVFLAVVILLFITMVIWTLDFSSIIDLTNRMINYTTNIPLIVNSHKLLTGFGLVSSGYFGTGAGLSVLHSSYVDSFYLYVLMTTGIVGCVLLIIPVVLFVKNLLNHIDKNAKNFNLQVSIAAMMLTLLYTGLFETCVLYSTFISCFMYWVIALSYNYNSSLKEI